MCRSRTNAFTLVEAIVAIVVLSIALPAILSAMSTAHTHRAASTMASTARWLASEKLEDLIADGHSPSLGYSSLVNSNYPAEPSVSGFASFSRSVSIIETGPDLVTAGTGYKRLVVTVGFADDRGVARQLTLETVLTEYTP
jgi:type II secretory pathway pseudopilin PulG